MKREMRVLMKYFGLVGILIPLIFVVGLVSQAHATVGLSVTKVCVDAAGPGQPITFHGIVCNTGLFPLSVTVVDVVDGQATTVFGPQIMYKGDCANYSGSYIPTTSPSTDTVTATAVGPEGGTVQASASATCSGNLGLGACRVTGGGNSTAGSADGGLTYDGTVASGKYKLGANNYDRYTFGGQAGANTALPPQPKGEWTHHQKSGPDGDFVFHAGTASAPPGTEISNIICSDEGYCDPARPAPFKQIDFDGVGTFKNIKDPSVNLEDVIPGVTYHYFQVHIEDLGEPGNVGRKNSGANGTFCPPDGSGTNVFTDAFGLADCQCADFYRIKIFAGVIPTFDPTTGDVTNLNTTDVIYQVFGYIDGGNLQIHPLTGYDQ